MQRDLPACGTVSGPSVSCPYNLFIALCVGCVGFFIKEKASAEEERCTKANKNIL